MLVRHFRTIANNKLLYACMNRFYTGAMPQ